MNADTIFQIKDADTNIKATATSGDDDNFVSVISPDYDAVITMSLSDFRRLVGAVDRYFA